MNYTANVKSVIKDYEADNVAFVTIEYTKGEKIVSKDYRISDPRVLKHIVRNQIEELERLDIVQDFIANPPIGVVELDAPPSVPTEEDIVAQVKEEQRRRLRILKEDVELGLIDLSVLQTEVMLSKLEISAVDVTNEARELK